MERKIIVYGHGDTTKYGFPTEADLVRYLKEGVFSEFGGRHQYTQNKSADIIVISRGGFSFGHLYVESVERPSPEDLKAYPRAKGVYLIRKTALYNERVRLRDLGITGIQFGRYIDEEQFDEIQRLSGGSQEFTRESMSKP